MISDQKRTSNVVEFRPRKSGARQDRGEGILTISARGWQSTSLSWSCLLRWLPLRLRTLSILTKPNGGAVMAMGLCGQHRSVGGRKTQMRAALLTLAVIGSQLRTPVAARLPDRGLLLK